jgi:Probable molybdopterin binding domain
MTTADSSASKEVVTAALLVIGSKILSGHTKDQNIGYIAQYLTALGIDLKEVRVVGDEERAIVDALNALRHRCAYVFTTGGIGPTRRIRDREAPRTANSPQPVEKASICITLITWPKQKVHRKAYMILPKPSIVGTPRAEPRDHRERILDQLWHSMQLKSACWGVLARR